MFLLEIIPTFSYFQGWKIPIFSYFWLKIPTFSYFFDLSYRLTPWNRKQKQLTTEPVKKSHVQIRHVIAQPPETGSQ